MKKFVVSACLAGQACRYDGASTPCPAVMQLVKDGVALPLCPEQLGDLPTPRSPCELRGDRVWTKDGHDCTAAFQRGAKCALRLACEAGCTVAILKSRSPSCGADGVYDGTFSKKLVQGAGVWANALLQHGFCVYTEEQLTEEQFTEEQFTEEQVTEERLTLPQPSLLLDEKETAGWK